MIPKQLHSAARKAARTLDDVPSPRGLPLFGSTISFMLAGAAPKLHKYVDNRHRELGPLFKDTIGPVTALFVSDPNYMRKVFSVEGKYPTHVLPESWTLYNQLFKTKRGLFFMDGEEWLQTRRIMNDLMLKPSCAEQFHQPCQIAANSLISLWERKGLNEITNLEEDLYMWSINTVLASLMGSKFKSEHWTDIVHELSSVVHLIFLESGRMSAISAKVARALHLPVWSRFVSAVDSSLSNGRKLIREALKVSGGKEGDGLLGSLLRSGLSEEDTINIAVDLIIAAGDTTALSTQWALYLLAMNPKTQEDLVASDSSRDALLQGIIRETLRLFPVAPFLTRILPEPACIGDYDLPAGLIVLLSLYTSGRDPKSFPEPERFWPERWIREASEGGRSSYHRVENPYASLPFAMGVRSCVGRKLAEVQMATTIWTIVSRYRLEPLNERPVDMQLRLTAVPSEPIRIHLSHRHDEPTKLQILGMDSFHAF